MAASRADAHRDRTPPLRPGAAVSITDPRHPAHGSFAVLDNLDRNRAWVKWRDGRNRLQWAEVPLSSVRRFGAARRKRSR